jgi:hypothetical protein
MTEIDTIISLWKEGLTATQIGDSIGKSRSSVLGKIYRLRRKGVIEDYRCPARSSIEKSDQGDLFKYFDLKKPEPVSQFKTIFDLGYRDCRYIVDRSDRGYLYCAKPKKRKSLCQEHYSMCYRVLISSS